MQFVKVVIVGAGAAGLGAAKTLDLNVDYLLIEAQNYIGGRIHTADAGFYLLFITIQKIVSFIFFCFI